jgi:hypothetical protein
MAGGQVTFDGSLHAGPSVVSETIFPSSSADAHVGLLPCKKPYTVATGLLSYPLASPSAFVTLSGVSPSLAGAVSRATFFYFRCESAMRLRLTIDGAADPDYTSVLDLRGILALEFPDENALLLVEAEGEGTIEYFASGT